LTVVQNRPTRDADHPVLPLSGAGRRVYVEGIRPEDVAELGEIVADPADADLALVRLGAPFEPRDDLFLEAWFHQGSLEFPPGRVYRMRRIAQQCPLVLVVNLDRPGILTPFAEFASAIVVDFGSSARAVLDVLTGRVAPRGACRWNCRGRWMPRAAREDVPSDTGDPLFAVHFGLELAVPATTRRPVTRTRAAAGRR
jgi:beta-glucosidase